MYIAGVARSGTTILTEMLARHPDVTSHRYSDFPNVFTPYWRNWLAGRVRRAPARAVERAHKDRLMVTTESPEAVEEVIWMHFFAHLHDPETSQMMGGAVENAAFESFYRDHVRKLLLVRGKSRYLTKGNYNITRLGYIRKMFPDARFVVPVRNPINHVASLLKQDRLFQRTGAEDPRVTEQLHRSGHFEFGLDKCCIHVGDADEARTIQALWAEGRAVEGWAMYWNAVYRSVRLAIECDPALDEAVSLVRYEDLCGEPGPVIDRLLPHFGLPPEPFEPVRREFIARLSEPDYYAPEFTQTELEAIKRATAETARWCGY
ncbi:MAG: sulfotransferase [Phycisphaerae bacterium]|nr:sulfotransferase [Phycisphaerae bacterium]